MNYTETQIVFLNCSYCSKKIKEFHHKKLKLCRFCDTNKESIESMLQLNKKVCDCGKGHISYYDGKCGNCRTKNEKWYFNRHVGEILNDE